MALDYVELWCYLEIINRGNNEMTNQTKAQEAIGNYLKAYFASKK